MATKKKQIVFLTMLVLGVIMIAIGLQPFPNIALPPFITGVGFLVIGWGFR